MHIPPIPQPRHPTAIPTVPAIRTIRAIPTVLAIRTILAITTIVAVHAVDAVSVVVATGVGAVAVVSAGAGWVCVGVGGVRGGSGGGECVYGISIGRWLVGFGHRWGRCELVGRESFVGVALVVYFCSSKRGLI